MGALKELWSFRQTLLVILTPLVLLPLPLAIPGLESKGAYGLLVMAVYWVTETIPLPVTALLPMVLFPLMGVAKAGDLSREYLKDTNMMFVGGLMVAVAVEKWNLHKRIALRVLLLVGQEPKWLMIGFMVPTWFLSMWISNTATTAMMVPIAQAVIDQLIDTKRTNMAKRNRQALTNGRDSGVVLSNTGAINGEKMNGNGVDIELSTHEKTESADKERPDDLAESGLTPAQETQLVRIRKGVTLCVAYAATCGGVATLTGTGPNLVLKGLADSISNNQAGINFTSWFIFAFPCSVLALMICYIWLQIYFLGIRNSIFFCPKKTEELKQEHKVTKKVLQKELEELGPMSFAEVMVSLHFAALALIWLTRESDFFDGWGEFIPNKTASDSTPAILLSVSLFIFPSVRPNFFCCRSNKDKSPAGPTPALLDWHTVTHKFSWGIVLLLGGGFALAKACQESGLSQLLANELKVLQDIPSWGLCVIITLLIAAITEVTSNVAIATIFLPILAQLAIGIGVNPLYLMVPGCVASSFAFMLPVATPPNAIVFSYGTLKVVDMAKAGFILNLICIVIVNVGINTWGYALFNLGEFPDWANNTLSLTKEVVKCINGTLV